MDINIAVNSNVKNTQKAFTNIAKDASRASISVAKFSNSLNQITGFGKVYAISQAMSTIVQSSLDVIETANLFSVSMGEMTTATQDFVEQVHNSFGFDQTNIQNAIGNFNLLARTMGFSSSQASVLSTNTYKLGKDLSSLMNVPINQVMQDLRSGLIGQTETVYKYGIDLTEASLAQEALNQGITKSVRNMSQGEKMALRYSLMIKQTTLAQGDFARTIDSPANQLRVLGERFITLGRAIGSMFIPMLTAVLPYLNAFVQILIDVFSAIAKLFGYEPPKLSNNLGGGFSGIEDGATDAKDAVGKTTKALKEMRNATLGIDELNLIPEKTSSDGAGGSGGSGLGAGANILEGLDLTGYDDLMSKVSSKSDEIYQKLLSLTTPIQTFMDAVSKTGQIIGNALVAPVGNAINMIIPKIANLAKTLSNVWGDLSTLSDPIVKWLTTGLLPLLQRMVYSAGVIISGLLDSFDMVFNDLWNIVIFPSVSEIINALLPMLTDFVNRSIKLFTDMFDDVKRLFDKLWSEGVKPSMELIMSIILDLAESIVNFYNNYATPIFTQLQDLWTNVCETLVNVWETLLEPMWNTFMDTVDWLWNKHLKPLVDNVLDLVGVFIQCALELINKFIVPLINEFVNKFSPIIKEVFDRVVSVISTSIALASDIINSLITILKGVIQFLTGVFTGNWKLAWTGIVNIFRGIFEGIKAIVKGVVNYVIDFINAMLRAVTRGVNQVISMLNKLDFEVPDWVPKIGGEKFGFNIRQIESYQIPKLAKGGSLEDGQLFQAGEFGKAEMVGSYQGKTTVMPLENTSFVDAIYNAVFNAMSSVDMSGQVIENVVNLDGDKIYANQQKITRNRGKDFGMGVFAR